MNTQTYCLLQKGPAVALCAATSLFLLSGEVAFSGGFASPPTFYLSSKDSSCTPTAYTAPLDPRNSASFRVQYQNPGPAGGLLELYPLDPTTNSYRKYSYAETTVTESRSFSYSGYPATVDLSATPALFDVKSRIRASSNGGDGFIGALSSVGHYFVVNGTAANQEIELVADLLFQGRVFANPNGGSEQNANAAFTNIVGVVQHPTDPTPLPQFALYMNGAASNQPWAGNACETFPNLLFEADNQPHAINAVIRSRSFKVTTRVRYRMNLNINASAGANGVAGAESYVDFLDPKLVTAADFQTVKDQNGQPVALSPTGFFLKTE